MELYEDLLRFCRVEIQILGLQGFLSKKVCVGNSRSVVKETNLFK